MRDDIAKNNIRGEEPIRLSSLDALLAALDSRPLHGKAASDNFPPAAMNAPAGFLLSLPLKNIFRFAKKEKEKEQDESPASRGTTFISTHATQKGDKHE